MPDEQDIVERLCERRKLRYMGNCKCGKCQLVPMELLDDAICELRRLRAASPSEVRKHDGRNIADSAPHAAYCDIALQDAQIEVMDNGERLWTYDDALFDKSLAANGYKVVPVGELPGAEVMEAARELIAVNEAHPYSDLYNRYRQVTGRQIEGVALEMAKALLAKPPA